MQKVIECVPNFSEGQRKEVMKRIELKFSEIISIRRLSIPLHMLLQVSKVWLCWILIQVYQQIEQSIVQLIKKLNFKVFLSRLAFVGHPQAVIEAALAAGRAAYNLIDMTRHTGEHPRIGAMVI